MARSIRTPHHVCRWRTDRHTPSPVNNDSSDHAATRRRGNAVVSETARTRHATCSVHDTRQGVYPPLLNSQHILGVPLRVYWARQRPVNVTKERSVGKFTETGCMGTTGQLSFSGHTERIPWLFAVSELTHRHGTKLSELQQNRSLRQRMKTSTHVLAHKLARNSVNNVIVTGEDKGAQYNNNNIFQN